MTTPVRAAADTYLAGLADLDPDAAQTLGREPGLLIPDLTPDGFAARVQLARSTRTTLAGTAPHDFPDRVLLAALTDRLDSEIALSDAGFTTRLLAPLATPVHNARVVFDQLPRDTEDDWNRVADHLDHVPVALDQYAATLRWSAERGWTAPARQAEVVAAQCETWVDPRRDDFYRGLVAGYAGDGSLRRRLDTAAVTASRATADFATFLRSELAELAPRDDAVGRDMYTVTARAFLGADVDLDEVYEYGWRELDAVRTEMREVAAEIAPGGVDAAIAALDADPARLLRGTDALRSWLQDRLDATTAAVAGTHFDIPAVSRNAECRIATAGSGVMYYTPPDPGLTRPGRIWWSPPGEGPVASWREVSTLHHEGVPGHHLQHAVTMTLPDLHPWQRSLCHVHGYAEGWAHYAERLAGELGLLRDPGERLGMLCGQMWRAARIVIDIGLHLGLPIPAGTGFTEATTWTPRLARTLLGQLASIDDRTAEFEVDRYLGWPGQALAFKVGARLWQQARTDAERRPGFDLKRFHADALALGPLGLDPLRAALAADRHRG